MKHGFDDMKGPGDKCLEGSADGMSSSCAAMRLRLSERFLVLAVFFTCLAGASVLPWELCPDEGARQLLSNWIYSAGALPTGNEPETIIPGYEFSYALRPYLSAIVAALFMRLVSLFTTSPHMLLVASRMCSVLSVTACSIFCLKLGGRLFRKRSSAWLLAVFVCFLPQVQFLGMYQNNDSLSLAAVCAILYYLVKCRDECWSVRSCIGLGVAFSVGLLSYYTIYGWILAAGLYCVVSVLCDNRVEGKGRFLGKRIVLVLGVCLVLAGWFFVRNAMFHQGDFLGMTSEIRQRAEREALGFELSGMLSLRDEGLSPVECLFYNDRYWINSTWLSFVGVFGNMDILMPVKLYNMYFFAFLFSVALYPTVALLQGLDKRDVLFVLVMLLGVCIAFGLHFWASYTRDFTPQGRYIITTIVLLGYLLAYGIDNVKLTLAQRPGEELHPAVALSVIWVLMFVLSVVTTMSRMLQ